jgi:hypothetical protein
MKAHHGIDLDGLLPSRATAASGTSQCTFQHVGDVPPAVLLGDLPGHPPWLDVDLPIDARGSGLGHTRSATTPRHAMATRLPIAYAWELLLGMREDGPPPTWSWPQHAEANGSITPGNAIAVAVRDVCREEADATERDDQARSTRTLVVPNFLEEHQQDHLLRALRMEVGSARLLWRPIAAAFTWLEDRGQTLARNPEHLRNVGSLLHLHLGAEHWEATVLELVQFIDEHGTAWVLPGRRLRDETLGAPVLGWPTRWLEQTAEHVLTNAHPPTDARRWNLLWASSWGRAAVLDETSRTRASAALPPWIAPSLADAGRQQLAAKLYAMPGNDSPGSRWKLTAEMLTSRKFSPNPEAWLQRLRAGLMSARLLGAVVTGPYAALPLGQGRTLGGRFVENLALLQPTSVLVEGADPAAIAVCARGAAEFGRRSDEGRPTYLDTLPSVSMIAMVHGEPEWINLLETDEPWVMGSQVWSKEPAKTRFRVQKGERDLTVVVHRGGSRTCRRVRTDFASPAADSSPVSLHVSITPGQGAPRVEVRPDDRRVLAGRSLTLDWTTAEDTGRNTTEELEAIDRVCPPHEPRLASHGKWAERRFNTVQGIRGIRDLIARFTEGATHIRTDSGSRKELLPWIRLLLKEWDQRINLGWATAVSSDGTLAAASPVDQAILDRFIHKLDARIFTNADEEREALRTLASISANSPRLREALDAFLTGHVRTDPASTWWVAGHCARQPEQIHVMVKLAISADSPTAFKQVARSLMFRRDALALTPPALAGRLLLRATAHARQLTQTGQFRQTFQECALLCAYLLRTRIYHPEFASPKTAEHEDLITTFEAALAKMQRGHVMGGVIDKEDLVRDILDYTRSRGRGRLVVYAQESDDE